MNYLPPLLLFLLLPVLTSAQAPANQNYWVAHKHLDSLAQNKTGLVYGKGGARELKLNLYRPANRKNDILPGIVFIHGGGWAFGDINSCTRQSSVLAAQGYVVACIEYRLLPNGRIKNCVEDCKTAVRWLRANAITHGVDPDHIGAIGGSAGGHLTAMLAITHKVKGLAGTGGNPTTDSQIQAAVAMATPSDLDNTFVRRQFKMNSAEAREVSPLRYIHAEQAPLLLLHCKQDRLVPYFSSSALALASRGVGADCTLKEIAQGGHNFWHKPQGWNEAMRAALPFFEQHLKPGKK